jgi:hypothetical protein
MNTLIRMQSILFCYLLIFVATTGSAWALTASNTQIINNARLSYDDGTGVTKTVNALPVVVTVSLLPGTPTVTKVSDETTPYTGTDTQLVNTFRITASNTNGPDTYTLVPAIIGTPTNTSGAGLTLTSPASPVLLGATVTLSGCTTTGLNVPADGNSGDNAVNGIAALDWVVVNGQRRQVSSIVDNATGTSTITLAIALSAAPGAGVLVGEQQDVTVTVRSGTITTAGQNIVINKQLTIASVTDPSKTADTSATPTIDTYTSGLATLSKYVRNVNQTAMTGTGTVYPYNSLNYWPSGITASPGEVLEYILVANNSGTGSVTAASITDALPTTYVSLATGAYSGGRDITYFNESNVASYLTAASGDDAATYASPTLTINVGTGATSALGGTIASGATVRVLYRATVNP